MTTLHLLTTPRTPHLKAIWADLCRGSELPQLDRWLAARLKQDKRFGSKDRRFYADAIFGIMRHVLGLQDFAGLDPDQAWEAIRKKDPAVLFEELETSLAKETKGLSAAGLSPWFEPFLAKRSAESQWSDEQNETFLKAQSERAPLWLRLNKAEKRSRLEVLLKTLDVPFEALGDSYKILVEKNLTASPIFEEGLAEVQDYGSQLLGHDLPVKPGSLVWDACAGGGGKSLQIACLHPEAQIFASDVRAYKSAEVERRALKARLRNIRAIPWDGSDGFMRPKAAKDGFDLILVDAPCSGSGTWRRSPDGRFRLSEKSVKDLAELQFSIVKKVLPHLKPKGELVYATCSWFVEENEEVVRRAERELGLQIVSQGLKGLPSEDSDTLFAARLKPQV